MTIQFPPGITGLIHFGFIFHAIFAGQPKQAASHAHPVRVGVTNNLTKFDADFVHKFHHAPGVTLHLPLKEFLVIGQNTGS